MDKALDMSLDDIIKNKKSTGRGGGGGGRGRGSGGSRGRGGPQGRGGERGGSFSGGSRMRGGHRGGAGPQRNGNGGRSLGVNARNSSSVSIAKPFRRAKNFPWQRDLLEDSLAAAGLPGMESGTKLFISNLDTGVSNHDIRELFSEIGELKRYAIHYDNTGRPSGSAEVVYTKRSDAFAAHKRYNNVQLDGRPMKIEIVSPAADTPASARISVTGRINGKATRRVIVTQSGRSMSSAPANRGAGQRRGAVKSGQRSQNQSKGQRSNRGRGKGQSGRGKKKPVDKSAEELDKELENYHAEGMQIS